MEKKKLWHNKKLCIIIMVALIVVSFFVGSMGSLNSRYNSIERYKVTRPVTYNRLAEDYNYDLTKFPAVIVAKLMPIKGQLEYVQVQSGSEEGTRLPLTVRPLSLAGAVILLVIAFKLLAAFFGGRR